MFLVELQMFHHTHGEATRLFLMVSSQGMVIQAEQGKRDYEQMKRTRTTSQATQTLPLLLAADAFSAALEAIPVVDWCRTWAAGRTIMLRRTLKRVKAVVDKMRLPAVVLLSRIFWYDARNGAAGEELQFVWRQLQLMTAWCQPNQHTPAAAL